jgi:hypothetical protein
MGESGADQGHRLPEGREPDVAQADREARTPWKTFLKAHWEILAASDFLTTEEWTKGGLGTYYIFFVIELSTRKVQIAGMTPNPEGRFMVHMARNLTDCQDGFLMGKNHARVQRGAIHRKQRLGGMLNYYYREAA